jgi:hypothetical protein
VNEKLNIPTFLRLISKLKETEAIEQDMDFLKLILNHFNKGKQILIAFEISYFYSYFSIDKSGELNFMEFLNSCSVFELSKEKFFE